MPVHRAVHVRGVARRATIVAIIVLPLLLLAGCPYAGQFLIIDEPLEKADVLVVLAGAEVERWLEAADLYREGYAAHLLLSPGYEDPLGSDLRARGIRYPRPIDVHRDAIVQLGVPAEAVEIMPLGYDNTAAEAAGVKEIARGRGWSRLIVVTSKYHTRRASFAFERELRDMGIGIQVRGSRYDRATPDRWWRKRSDLRFVISEWQKLIAYRLGAGS